MIIKASTALRNEYTAISDMAKKTQEPIYITRNGEGDMVVMNIDAFERREQIIKLRENVMKAEQQRLDGAATLSVEEARKKLRERIDAM